MVGTSSYISSELFLLKFIKIPFKMNDLIQITQTQIGAENVNSVNAREIHTFLEVKTKFNDWIARAVEKYDFIENLDFYSFLSKTSGRPSKEYIVTLDMAKELSMLENNPKGKETRKYFIRVEKQSQKVLSVSEQISLIAQGHQEIDSRITKLEETKKLEYWQEKALQDAKNQTVYHIADRDDDLAKKLHRKVWALFKKQFHLPRYNELPAIKFEEGLEYIRNLTLADMV